MQDLQVVAVTSDGSAVVVADDAGRQYRLRIDDRLKAAVRGERLHEGQLEITLSSQLSPRDIQARVRSGATVDEVAEVAGVSTERVLRYAAPVLDERRHVAQQAQRAFVRTEGLTELGPLGEVVGDAVRARGAGDSLRWDAWRREDGRWLVVSRWAEAGTERAALWLLDPSGRSVAAHDDDARSLAGLPSEARAAPTRLAVVRDEEKATSGEAAAAAAAARASQSEDDTPTGPIPGVVAAAAPPAPSPARPARPRSRTGEDERLWLTDIADNVVVEEPARASGEGGSSRRQRPPVPSWDEIMFGRRG